MCLMQMVISHLVGGTTVTTGGKDTSLLTIFLVTRIGWMATINDTVVTRHMTRIPRILMRMGKQALMDEYVELENVEVEEEVPSGMVEEQDL
ncbi:hypothetical protein J1N35_014480 [Gossypium stocksii]|uniref:Uncharacterized protein n=1 Tax=Gossypium stocksii TaxID=47602 RepID=A0A9D3VX37_9ROSI|nr:hypothetical protein J1N35_014480 [Gossypium stocksii]